MIEVKTYGEIPKLIQKSGYSRFSFMGIHPTTKKASPYKVEVFGTGMWVYSFSLMTKDYVLVGPSLGNQKSVKGKVKLLDQLNTWMKKAQFKTVEEVSTSLDSIELKPVKNVKEILWSMNPNDFSQLKEAYYGVMDNLRPIIESLPKELRAEKEIFSKMLELTKKSEIGKYL